MGKFLWVAAIFLAGCASDIQEYSANHSAPTAAPSGFRTVPQTARTATPQPRGRRVPSKSPAATHASRGSLPNIPVALPDPPLSLPPPPLSLPDVRLKQITGLTKKVSDFFGGGGKYGPDPDPEDPDPEDPKPQPAPKTVKPKTIPKKIIILEDDCDT